MKLIVLYLPWVLWVNTAVAWGGVILTITITLSRQADNKKPGRGPFRGLPEGTPGIVLRGMQQLTHFTMWSKIWLPLQRLCLHWNRRNAPMQAPICALMMILATAVVYGCYRAHEPSAAGPCHEPVARILLLRR